MLEEGKWSKPNVAKKGREQPPKAVGEKPLMSLVQERRKRRGLSESKRVGKKEETQSKGKKAEDSE